MPGIGCMRVNSTPYGIATYSFKFQAIADPRLTGSGVLYSAWTRAIALVDWPVPSVDAH